MAKEVKKYYSVKQYAAKEGITISAVYQAIEKGRLAYEKIDRMYLIPKNALLTGKRQRTGALNGISKLKNGDIEGFLGVRGFRITK